MGTSNDQSASNTSFSRRDFLRRSAAAAALPALTTEAATQSSGNNQSSAQSAKPNIILIIADQFRWDAVGAYGLNSMGLTPNLDGMARRGVLFRSAITNQPLCSPSRACLFTGQYPNHHGVWKNGLGLAPDAVTLATVLRQAGYTANYVGKWHLAPNSNREPATLRAVASEHRGGFLDFWEASNVLELTSHPYEGDIWDGQGNPIHFSDVYRVDFITQRAVHFLQNSAHTPFLLVVSYIEPHFQNDCNCFVPPKEYAERFNNPFVPEDLRFFPGDWQKQLPNYYGCIARVDDAVGTILQTLSRAGLEKNTIVTFLSDHGCHFRTRNDEYKRSPHESSIHIPLVIQGPRFNRALSVPELVSQIDVTPTLLDAVGVPVPDTMQGRSAMPLLDRRAESWRNEVYIQISESETGRALRTPEWTYAVVAPPISSAASNKASERYVEYQMYNLNTDPHQLVNLAGRRDPHGLVHYSGHHSINEIAIHLRERLQARMMEAGEVKAIIDERALYP